MLRSSGLEIPIDRMVSLLASFELVGSTTWLRWMTTSFHF